MTNDIQDWALEIRFMIDILQEVMKVLSGKIAHKR